MRSKRKYMNGQSRGGVPGVAVDTDNASRGRTPKRYHTQAVSFQGGETAVENWVKGGRRGYGA